MAQLARERADAASACDQVFMIVHEPNVRLVRTSVNGLDNVRAFCDDTYMQDRTPGAALLALKERAGNISLEEIAKAGGYARKSSVQEYFKESFAGPLSSKVAEKLADALEGKGSPPIARDEIMSLVGDGRPAANASVVRFEGASLHRLASDLPVFGTALGAEKLVDGEAIEQTYLNSADIIEYRKRPLIAHGVEKVYGLYVQGSSMYPAHRDGAFLFVQKDARLRIGDDVVVYLRPMDESDNGERATSVLVKRLVKRTAQYVELEQFTPPKTFRLSADEVLRIDRVLTTDDYA